MVKLVIRVRVGDTIYSFTRWVSARPEIEINLDIPPAQGFTMTEDEMLAYMAECGDA